MPSSYGCVLGDSSNDSTRMAGAYSELLESSVPFSMFGRSAVTLRERATFDLIELSAFNNPARRKWCLLVRAYEDQRFYGNITDSEFSFVRGSSFFRCSSGLDVSEVIHALRLCIAAKRLLSSDSMARSVTGDIQSYGDTFEACPWGLSARNYLVNLDSGRDVFLRRYATPLMLLCAVWRVFHQHDGSFPSFTRSLDSDHYYSAMSSGARIGLLSASVRSHRSDRWQVLCFDESDQSGVSHSPSSTRGMRRRSSRLLSWQVPEGALTFGIELEVDRWEGSSGDSGRALVAEHLNESGWSASSSDWSTRVRNVARAEVVPDGTVPYGGELRSGIFDVSSSHTWSLFDAFVRDACKALQAAGGEVLSRSSAGMHLHIGRGRNEPSIAGLGKPRLFDEESVARYLSATVGGGYSNWARLLPNRRRAGSCSYATRAGNFNYDLREATSRSGLSDWSSWLRAGYLICGGHHTAAVDSSSQHDTLECRLGAASVLPFKVLGWAGLQRQLALRSMAGRGSVVEADSCVEYVSAIFDHDEVGLEDALELARFRDEYHRINGERGIFVSDAPISEDDCEVESDPDWCGFCEAEPCCCEEGEI